MKASGNVIVVTGAGNGIGRAVALELLNRGATIAGVDLSTDGLAETIRLAGATGKNMSAHPLSITNRKLVAALPKAVIATHGQVDGLINVAGIIHKFKNKTGYHKRQGFRHDLTRVKVTSIK
jgi:NAD(P)-dependent dehydrogenase (short-subunit alcohol dehydrogenase family)